MQPYTPSCQPTIFNSMPVRKYACTPVCPHSPFSPDAVVFRKQVMVPAPTKVRCPKGPWRDQLEFCPDPLPARLTGHFQTSQGPVPYSDFLCLHVESLAGHNNKMLPVDMDLIEIPRTRC